MVKVYLKFFEAVRTIFTDGFECAVLVENDINPVWCVAFFWKPDSFFIIFQLHNFDVVAYKNSI